MSKTISSHQSNTNLLFKHRLDYFQKLCSKKKEDFHFDEIELGRYLGSGGFGTVHECLIKGQKYALKRFHITARNARAAQESFTSENMAIRLQHRNIVRTFCTFLKNQSHYILMEYLNARTLQSILDDENETVLSRRRIKFAKQIASGLAYAHKKNIVHLDLKPLNILVSQATDQCKIADFGCCKDLSEISSPTTPTKTSLTGTYSYRAPELLRGEPATDKADIYSFGICLWQMATRERPYGNENHQVIIFKVVAYNLRPCIPEDTEKLYSQVMTGCWDQCKDNRMNAREIIQFFTEHF
ncbi:serine/threonine-protein kinase mos-like [Clytia hemisphaerica]|uniref:non-specific serine/threonine protein kinase n=1 Tax=Clytia hemisphaerica TaxID=252671 RepID=C0J9J2_9CNID|nr:protein kinase Mos2 [Clytia hemisphaerica]|eukprot:TCONS_00012147-protein